MIINSFLKDLELKIRNISELDFVEQKLLYINYIIDDDNKMLTKYGLTDGKPYKYGMQIFATTVNGKTFSIGDVKCYTVFDIKKKIEDMIGLSPEDQKLVYQGEILEDEKTVDEYQIGEKSVINVLSQLRGGMQISIKKMNGETVMVDVTDNNRVIDIKKKIQEKIGLLPEEQKLMYEGEVLQDQKTVRECKFTKDIHVDVILRSGIQISVRTMNGEMVSFEVTNSDRVIDIKKKIQEKIQLVLEGQSLVFNGVILEDGKTVDECNITENCVINIVTRLVNITCVMKIFVEIVGGKRYELNVLSVAKIIDLKKYIQENMQLPIIRQTLVYQGVLLDNEKTVEYYEIDDGSVILVMVSPRRLMGIFVSVVGGERYRLNVTSTDTIIDIKKKIRDVTGMDASKRPLVYQGVALDDDHTVDFYEIDEGSVILSLKCH